MNLVSMQLPTPADKLKSPGSGLPDLAHVDRSKHPVFKFDGGYNQVLQHPGMNLPAMRHHPPRPSGR